MYVAIGRGRKIFQPERLTKFRKIEVLAWPGGGGALLQKLISAQFVNNLFSAKPLWTNQNFFSEKLQNIEIV